MGFIDHCPRFHIIFTFVLHSSSFLLLEGNGYSEIGLGQKLRPASIGHDEDPREVGLEEISSGHLVQPSAQGRIIPL